MTMQKKMLKTAAAACAAALAAVLLAGCGDEASKKTYSPVPFTKHDRCHLCGMVLAHYVSSCRFHKKSVSKLLYQKSGYYLTLYQ